MHSINQRSEPEDSGGGSGQRLQIQKMAQKGVDEAIKTLYLKNLVDETNPNEAKNEAAKCFRFDPVLERTQKRTR